MILPTIWESRKATLTFLGVVADLAIVALAAFGQLETAIATEIIETNELPPNKRILPIIPDNEIL